MIYVVINAAIAAFGALYAAKPSWFLRRKYMYEDEIPAVAIRTARVVGVLLVVIGAAGMVYNLAFAA